MKLKTALQGILAGLGLSDDQKVKADVVIAAIPDGDDDQSPKDSNAALLAEVRALRVQVQERDAMIQDMKKSLDEGKEHQRSMAADAKVRAENEHKERIKTLLDTAVADGRIAPDQRPNYEAALAGDFDTMSKIVGSLPVNPAFRKTATSVPSAKDVSPTPMSGTHDAVARAQARASAVEAALDAE